MTVFVGMDPMPNTPAMSGMFVEHCGKGMAVREGKCMFEEGTARKG